MSSSVLVVSFQLSDHGGTFKRLKLWNSTIFDANFHLLYSARTQQAASEAFTSSNSSLKVTELANRKNRFLNYCSFVLQVSKTLRQGDYRFILPIGTAAEIITFLSKSLSRRECKTVIYRAGSPIPVKRQGSLTGGVMRYFLKVVYRNSYRIIAINESLRDIVIDDFGVNGSQVTVVPISVTMDENQQRCIGHRMRSCEELVFGVMARLTEEKGVQYVLEAVQLLRESSTHNITLLIYGEGRYRQSLEAKATSLGISDIVFFKGWIDNQFEALATIDCLLIGSRFEGTPRSILEAALLRIPTVSTGVGGIPSVITHGATGWLYEYADTDALVRILKSVDADPEALSRAGVSVNKLVTEKYSLDTESANLRKVFGI